MDDFKSFYPNATAATVTTNSDCIDENAIVLASLLQELSFWEPSTPDFAALDGDGNSSIGLMRKSRSVNDATAAGDNARNNHHRLPHSTSPNGSTTYKKSDDGINGNIYSIPNVKGCQQCQNISSYDNTEMGVLSDYVTSKRNDDSQFLSSLNNTINDKNTSVGQDARQQKQQQQQQQQRQPGSPTLAELQESCFWNKAVDPASGRTYYYDFRTRYTQWEKVRVIKVAGWTSS